MVFDGNLQLCVIFCLTWKVMRTQRSKVWQSWFECPFCWPKTWVLEGSLAFTSSLFPRGSNWNSEQMVDRMLQVHSVSLRWIQNLSPGLLTSNSMLFSYFSNVLERCPGHSKAWTCFEKLNSLCQEEADWLRWCSVNCSLEFPYKRLWIDIEEQW